MKNGKTFLAIIPARSGSKRLPRKNILHLAGKPLIAWTIEAATSNSYIDKVIVTSDSEEILDISKKYGSETIHRSDELSSDTATTFDAIRDVLSRVEKYDYIILLQATSPLRTKKHINKAIELLLEKSAKAVISVCEMEHSPFWSNTLPDDGKMANFLRHDVKNKRSQDLEKYYRVNGAIYICETKKLLHESTFFINNNIYAYKMNQKSSIDIDTKIDFQIASVLI